MSKLIPKASEVINQIQVIIDEHGDLPLVVLDADTGWPLIPNVEFDQLDSEPFIALQTSYNNVL